MSRIVGLLFAVYLASYLWLSRRGYEQADQWNLKGFYYFTPQPTREWEIKHSCCVNLFAPINTFDRALGTGHVPSDGGMTWGLSR